MEMLRHQTYEMFSLKHSKWRFTMGDPEQRGFRQAIDDCSRLFAAYHVEGVHSQTPPEPAISSLPSDRPLRVQQRPLNGDEVSRVG